jgi:hypothetical protein
LADQQLQTEDWLLFASTVLGSVGMMATNNPMYYLYGLTVARDHHRVRLLTRQGEPIRDICQ